MKKRSLFIGLILVVLIAGYLLHSASTSEAIKVGVITPLSGSSAYWGESALIGVKMAQSELAKEGVTVSFISQDGQLDPATALNAAQKLVNVDHVSAIYSEFNPAAIAVSSFLKGKKVFHLYDSAATSPLDNGPYNFKTYLDYEGSCREAAQYIKDKRGIERVGVLEMNIEHGILCAKGIREVYGDDAIVESYDPSATDFRVQLSKLDHARVGAIFHASFQPETLASLREMHDLKMGELFVGLAETITPDVAAEFGPLIEGDVFFGLPSVNLDLMAQIKSENGGKDVADYNAAALAYVHLVQLGKAVSSCSSDDDCVATKMAQASPVPSIGFEGFIDRIAQFDTLIVEWRKGQFTAVALH